MSSMEAKVEILWNSLLLTWSYDYRVAGIHTFDKDGLAIGENLIERLNLETSWGTVTILETTDTSITFIHNGTGALVELQNIISKFHKCSPAVKEIFTSN